MFYIFSTRSIGGLSIVPRPENIKADMDYVQGSAFSGPRTIRQVPGGGATARRGRASSPPSGRREAAEGLNVRGLPLAKPPYGVITAIDLKKGEMLWRVPHGDTPDDVRNHPRSRV